MGGKIRSTWGLRSLPVIRRSQAPGETEVEAGGPKHLAALLLVGGLLGAWYALAQVLPPGADFYYWYYLTPQAWWSGDTILYDDLSRGYYLLPWGIWVYLLPALLLPEYAMALMTLASAGIIGWVAFRWSGSRAIGVLAALCPYSLVLYVTGTPDAWSLLGVYLMWRGVQQGRGTGFGAGLMLALIRPQNCLLLLPALAPSLMRWPAGELLRATGVVAAVLVGSVATSGIDWPVRWVENLFHARPSPGGVTTMYTVLEQAGIPLWASGGAGILAAVGALALVGLRQGGPGVRAFERLTALNGVLAPYLRSPGYVVLLALPWAGLAARNPRLAALPFAISLPTAAVPLFWEQWWHVWRWMPIWDLLFPVSLALVLFLEGRRGTDGGEG